MNKFSFNKYLITSILSIPIFYYGYNSNNVWKFIKHYDSKKLFEPMWKVKFNENMNSETVDIIVDTIKSNNPKNYLRFEHNDIYCSGWNPDIELISNEVNKKIKLSEKINSEKKYNLRFVKIDGYPYYNRIILELNENTNNEVCVNVEFSD